MTKRLKLYLFILFAALTAACTLAGCRLGRPELKDVVKGYDVHVVYFANGGKFNNMDIAVKETYSKTKNEADKDKGVAFFEITETTADISVGRDDYVFSGWYVPEKDEGGEPIYTYYAEDGTAYTAHVKKDSKGNTVLDKDIRPVYVADGFEGDIAEKYITLTPSSTRVTQEYIIKNNSDFTVCAMWAPALRVSYILVCEEGKTYTDANGTAYKNGDVIFTEGFGTDNYYTPSTSAPIKLNGASFAQTYADEQLTKPGSSVSRDNPVVYSHYIDGDGWTVVKDANGVRTMFNGLTLEGNKYYFYTKLIEGNEIDCSKLNLSVKNADSKIVATVEGNGVTLANLTVKSEGLANWASCSAFGTLGGVAALKNITFSDMKVEVTGIGNLTFYALFSAVEEGATLSGIAVQGISAKVDVANNITNISESKQDNWLIGGLASGGTDEDFLASHTGITVSGATLEFSEN